VEWHMEGLSLDPPTTTRSGDTPGLVLVPGAWCLVPGDWCLPVYVPTLLSAEDAPQPSDYTTPKRRRRICVCLFSIHNDS
jgi:hypothetical protein